MPMLTTPPRFTLGAHGGDAPTVSPNVHHADFKLWGAHDIDEIARLMRTFANAMTDDSRT
jgi:hypothetical protein